MWLGLRELRVPCVCSLRAVLACVRMNLNFVRMGMSPAHQPHSHAHLMVTCTSSFYGLGYCFDSLCCAQVSSIIIIRLILSCDLKCLKVMVGREDERLQQLHSLIHPCSVYNRFIILLSCIHHPQSCLPFTHASYRFDIQAFLDMNLMMRRMWWRS